MNMIPYDQFETKTYKISSKQNLNWLPVFILVIILLISCNTSKEEQNYKDAVNDLNISAKNIQQNLKSLSNLNQKAGLLQKKVTDSKTTNTKTKLYFSQIQSAVNTTSKNQENFQKQIQIKTAEYKKGLSSNLYKQKTQEIN